MHIQLGKRQYSAVNRNVDKIADYFSVSADYLLGLDSKKYIEITGLTNAQISLIQQLINAIKS